MNIPDPVVYVSIPSTIAGLIWAGRQFVYQTVGKQGNQGIQGDQGPEGPPGHDAFDMTVRDYKILSEQLVKELNGRYMLANESRERFMALEGKIDDSLTQMRSTLTSRTSYIDVMNTKLDRLLEINNP